MEDDKDGEGRADEGERETGAEDGSSQLSPGVHERTAISPSRRIEEAETAGASHLDPIVEGRAAESPLRHEEPDPTSGRALHRAGTLPVHRPQGEIQQHVAATTRKRGRTISARDKSLESQRQLSPRTQLFKRPSIGRGEHSGHSGEGNLGAIPERGHPEASSTRPRGSTTSERPSFVSPGMRQRVSTWAVGPGPQRRGTINRRPSVRVAQATGIDNSDAQSANFTLAGPALETVAANQPYVDPGYTDLNPAYDQPVNTRPVWGLAKPLPRVIRPGMVPSKSELRLNIPDTEQQRQDAANVDLEQGRVQATMNLRKITQQLENARVQRENQLMQTYSLSPTGNFSPDSPLGRKQSNIASVLSPASEAVQEEGGEEEGVEKSRTHELAPVLEQSGQLEGQTNYFPDDASSILTEKAGDGDLDGDWIGEELPLKAYDPETDEIHNLHTHWSVIRLRFREPLAELLAVTVQLTLGFCSDLVVTTSSSKAGNEATTDWAWGLATMVGIYIAGGISGAHLNPAISIMLWIYRGFPLRKVPVYMLAQILGAFIAALISFGLFQRNIVEFGGTDLGNGGTLGDFITFPRYEWIDACTAFFTEFTATAILAVAVLALGDDTNAPPGAGMNAFILGLVVTVLSMAFGYNTGAAMNPARDLGPRLALWAVGYGGKLIFGNGYWVYGPWAATIAGAIFGAFLYDVAIFVGGESPVNYPRRRIKRAGRKWKRRWGRRLRGKGRYGEVGEERGR